MAFVEVVKTPATPPPSQQDTTTFAGFTEKTTGKTFFGVGPKKTHPTIGCVRFGGRGSFSIVGAFEQTDRNVEEIKHVLPIL